MARCDQHPEIQERLLDGNPQRRARSVGVGAITKTTMREFGAACIAALLRIVPADVERLREFFHFSQPVFARYLNTTESTVAK